MTTKVRCPDVLLAVDGPLVRELVLKLRYVYIPVLFVALGFIAGYFLLTWWLSRTGLVPVRQDLTTFWLPFALVWFPIFWWILPRFKVLRFAGDTNPSDRLEVLVSLATMLVPTVTLQHFLADAGRSPGPVRFAFTAFGAGAALFLLMVLAGDLHEARLHQLIEAGWTAPLRRSLVPSRETRMTRGLLYLNVAVFLAMVFCGLGVERFGVADLIRWGGSARPLMDGFGFLRLVTSQFVHGGVVHLLSNAYGLFFAGLLLEPIIGNRRLLVAYLTTGTAAGIASVIMHPATVSVGASGSIFGLFGVLLGLLATRDQRLIAARGVLLVNTVLFVGLNLLIGAAHPGVDNSAHVAGVIAGLLLAPLFRLGRPPAG